MDCVVIGLVRAFFVLQYKDKKYSHLSYAQGRGATLLLGLGDTLAPGQMIYVSKVE